MGINVVKNRNRDPFSFANINLLGKCNCSCFFCLGEDIHNELEGQNQLAVHFGEWKNFNHFLKKCQDNNVKKLYITGQNTDSLMYHYLEELIDYLHYHNFDVGLRTNGYLAEEKMSIINKTDLSVGYSIHSLHPVTTNMIVGRSDMPRWDYILRLTERPRVQIVVNRCNKHEFFDILKYLQHYPRIRYIQARRVSTDTRLELLAPDIAAYEELYTQVSQIFPLKEKIFGDAEVYTIYGQDVVFWRTVKTTANSLNYFTDGTVSEEYFVVEGYLKNRSDRKI